jgi:hypothetical protein
MRIFHRVNKQRKVIPRVKNAKILNKILRLAIFTLIGEGNLGKFLQKQTSQLTRSKPLISS